MSLEDGETGEEHESDFEGDGSDEESDEEDF